MKKTTLKDVAEAAGVSAATVSMILSGKGKISSAMKDKVLALADELGYQQRKSSKTRRKPDFEYVAVLQQETVAYLWNFSVPFSLMLEEQVLDKGRIPLVFHVPANYTPQMLFKEITGAQVGVVFAIHYIDRDLFNALEKEGIPVIILNNSEYQRDFWAVLSDDYQASYEAAQHLISLGHERIAYADYFRPKYTALVADRLLGCRRALEERGLPCGEGTEVSVDCEDYASLVEKVRTMHSGERPPTAWVAHDDFFAAYLIEALKTIGKRIPEDVSVIAAGGDVLDYSRPFIPKIDTMQSDKQLMVTMAWTLMETRLQTPSAAIQVLKTKMTYIDRGSCRRIG